MIEPRLRRVARALTLTLAAVLAPPASHASGPPPAPTQVDAPDPEIRFERFRLAPVARFAATARVLARRDYADDEEAALAPIDLALGWGRMADPTVLRSIAVTQSNRWYHWVTRRAPIPLPEIARSSANMHFIPANAAVASALARVRSGDVVEIAGRLVDARRDDGWTWRTSRRRDDAGEGACEIVWLESIRVL